MKKIILIIPIIIIVAFAVIIEQSYLGTKVVAGQVYDCLTKQPIANATIVAAQQGWGWDPYLIWDKAYPVVTQTDSSGKFRLEFNHGRSANLQVRKDSYRRALQWEFPNLDVSIGLLSGDMTKNSYNCTPEEECMASRQDGNITVVWNKCTDPEPKPYK